MTRRPLDWVLVYLKGMAMGAADVVPGVSGGTVAFISGIYEELLHSLRGCNPATLLAVLWREGPAAAWRQANATFLMVLLAGVGTSVLSLARLIRLGLEQHPEWLWSFFFGLILASALMIYRQAATRSRGGHALLICGALMAYAVTQVAPAAVEPTLWAFFLSACLAICAMILPGISGAFILLLLGMYGPVITAIDQRQWLAVGVFLLGCGVGLLSFAHLLSWLFRQFHDRMLLFLTGVLLGSLVMVWPWKHTTQTVLDRHGELRPVARENVWPGDYQGLTGEEPTLGVCLVLLALGLALMPVLQAWARRRGGAPPES